LNLNENSKKEKLIYSGSKNFFTDSSQSQINEMTALAAVTKHSKVPIQHWIISWQENEQPSHEQIEDAFDVFLDRMGLAGHQVIYSLHGNSANPLHIAVNRTNPYIRLSRCEASLWNNSPRYFLNFPNKTLRRRLGIHTIWYLHSHFV
jgi:hypothetical protein